jgi:hypothetical protein
LTHHLVHDDTTDAFLEELIAVSITHPAVRWLDARDTFVPAMLSAA